VERISEFFKENFSKGGDSAAITRMFERRGGDFRPGHRDSGDVLIEARPWQAICWPAGADS